MSVLFLNTLKPIPSPKVKIRTLDFRDEISPTHDQKVYHFNTS